MLVAYCRVSTDKQTHDLQLDAVTQAGAEKVFIETASGAARDRPELAKALEFMRGGDCLVVWRLDRLARSVRQLVETIEELEGRGIQFRSLTEAIDTTTPAGRLTFHIFASMAEFERSLIRERVRAGLEAAKARGRVGGRPRAMTDAKLKAAKVLLADAEVSAAEVARHLGVSLSSLYRAFPKAKGDAGRWAAPTLARTPTLLAPDEVV